MRNNWSWRKLWSSRGGRGQSWRSRAEQSAPAETFEPRVVLSAVSASQSGAVDLHQHSGIERVARIVNGTQSSGYPAVGLIGDTADDFCSGTLIAPQYVLTAGHCAVGVADTVGTFTIGGHTYHTEKVYLNPGYNDSAIGSDSANDIAIYKLNEPVVGIAPMPIFRGTPQVGQLLTLVGFGGGGTGTTGSNGDFGIKRVGTTPIDNVTPKLIEWNFDNNSESNTAPGDSGGPAFVTVGGVKYIAGVTSGGDSATSGIGDHSYDTRVDAYADWIATIAGLSSGGDVPVVSVRATDAVAAETRVGQPANRGQYQVSRTGPTAAPLIVFYTMSGSATNGIDYSRLSGSVTIPAGRSSVTMTVSPIDDSLVEGTEDVVLTITPRSTYSKDVARNSATITIEDNDTAARTNDNFADRRALTGSNITATGDNRSATLEVGEPNPAEVSGGKSVWWTWTAPSTGRFTISTAGSSFDTTLGVYTGSSLTSLQLVAENDDADSRSGIVTSQVTFNAVAGTKYQILVDGYDGASGDITLRLNSAGTTFAASRLAVPRRDAVLMDSVFQNYHDLARRL